MFQFKTVTTERISQESEIRTTIAGGSRDSELKSKIKTPINFFSHMIEQWAWRSCLNYGLDVNLTGYRLDHVITEDSGMAFGQALSQVFYQLVDTPDGANGAGSSFGMIDEAAARVGISFEYRSGFYFNPANVKITERVEDMNSADLIAFLGGLAQGGPLTLQIDLLAAEDPHHLWEAVFRGLGEATRAALSPCPWRSGTTPGVAGKIRKSSK